MIENAKEITRTSHNRCLQIEEFIFESKFYTNLDYFFSFKTVTLSLTWETEAIQKT